MATKFIWRQILGLREPLTADRTYYVRTDGSDLNTGLTNSAAGAFRTIQKAVNTACSIDALTYNVTIQIADGTYPENIFLGRTLGSGIFTIQGNSATPANVSIAPTIGNIFTLAHACNWTIKDLKISGGTGAKGLYSRVRGAHITFSNINFGPMPSGQHIQAESGQISCTGSYTISGAAGQHYYANMGGLLFITSVTVTITGTPAFTHFIVADTSVCFTHLLTFSGSATGTRYHVSLNAVIFVNGGGANYFPGNVGGVALTGGQYA